MPAKKRFNEVNPALQYITLQPVPTEIPAVEEEQQNVYTHTDEDKYEYVHEDIDKDVYADADDDNHTPAYTDTPVQTRTYRHKETKSRRLQLLIRPGTYNALQQEALRQDTSVNDIINVALEKYVTSLKK